MGPPFGEAEYRGNEDAILPHLDMWLHRGHGGMRFHFTHILMGHRCFGSYLSRIQKVNSPVCEHCESEQDDTAEHTLRTHFCQAWAAERETLAQTIDEDLSLGTVVKISESDASW